MDIFNRKKVAELEKKLKEAEEMNSDLKRHLESAEYEIRDLVNQNETRPNDCVTGKYCNACVYAKKYEYESYIYGGRHAIIDGIMCLKGQVCPNFIYKNTEG